MGPIRYAESPPVEEGIRPRIDLVIMTTDGSGGLNGIIGSAAEKVVRKSLCPKLTIPFLA